MGDITEELARKFHRTASPRRHCCTCICNETSECGSKVILSTPRLDTIRDYHYQDATENRDIGRRPRYCRFCDSPRPIGYEDTSMGISRYMDKLYYWDQKYAMLDNWFKRFDFDNDGYLSLTELKCLLDRLGVPVRHFNVKNIFDQADRDCDGKLSFSEFLLMWRMVASFEISSNDGCDELQAVIRQHQLYPDVIEHSQKQYLRYDPLVMENDYARYPAEQCFCCRYGSFIKTADDSREPSPLPSHISVVNNKAANEKKSESNPSKLADLTKKTIFSCNRYSIY